MVYFFFILFSDFLSHLLIYELTSRAFIYTFQVGVLGTYLTPILKSSPAPFVTCLMNSLNNCQLLPCVCDRSNYILFLNIFLSLFGKKNNYPHSVCSQPNEYALDINSNGGKRCTCTPEQTFPPLPLLMGLLVFIYMSKIDLFLIGTMFLTQGGVLLL